MELVNKDIIVQISQNLISSYANEMQKHTNKTVEAINSFKKEVLGSVGFKASSKDEFKFGQEKNENSFNYEKTSFEKNRINIQENKDFENIIKGFENFSSKFDSLIAVPFSNMLLGPFSRVIKDTVGMPISTFFKNNFFKSFNKFMGKGDISVELRGIRNPIESIYKMLQKYFVSKYQAFSPVQDIGSKGFLGGFFNKLKGGISGFLSKGVGIISKFLPYIASIGAIVGSGIMFFNDFKKAGGFAKWKESDAKGKGNIVASTLFGGAQGAYKEMTAKQVLPEALKQAMKWGLMGAGIGFLVGGPVGALAGLGIGALVGFGGAYTKFAFDKGIIQSLYSDITVWVSESFNKIKDSIRLVIKNISDWIGFSFSKVGSWVSDKIDFFKEFGGNIINSAKKGISSMINWVSEKFKGIGDWLKNQKVEYSDLFSNIVTSVTDFIMPIIDGILEPFKALAKFFTLPFKESMGFLGDVIVGKADFFDIFDLDSALYSKLNTKESNSGVVNNTNNSSNQNITYYNSQNLTNPTNTNPTSNKK